MKPKQLALYTKHRLEMEGISPIWANVIMFQRHDRACSLQAARAHFQWVDCMVCELYLHKAVFLESRLGWVLLQNAGIVGLQ